MLTTNELISVKVKKQTKITKIMISDNYFRKCVVFIIQY